LDTINVVDELISKFTVSNNPGKTNEEIIFTDLSTSITPIVKWTWELDDFDGEVIILDTSSSLIKAYEYPFTYYTVLTVTDINGCSSSDTIPLKITGDFEAPNVFTPNFDNINDVFVFNHDIFDHYDVLILNRWGNVVFEQKNVTGTAIWNGMDNNNKKCTDGVYFYQVKGFLKDLTPFEKSGYVTKITGY
jgi:gliding motility-associated-like protein